MIHEAKIVLTGHGQGTVELDGVKVDGVVALAFTAGVGSHNRLTLRLDVQRITIETPTAGVESLFTVPHDLGMQEH